MFAGETLCFAVYGVKVLLRKKNKKQEISNQKETTDLIQEPSTSNIMSNSAAPVGPRTDVNPLLLAIPAALDVCGSTLMNVALTMTAASIYQMIRGIIVLIVAAMARIFLKKKQYVHHLVSLAVLFIGVFLVGLSSMLGSSDDPDDEGNDTSALGLMLLIVAQFFTATQFIVEEKLLGSYELDPLKVVGLEGMWGLTYWAVLLPIF